MKGIPTTVAVEQLRVYQAELEAMNARIAEIAEEVEAAGRPDARVFLVHAADSIDDAARCTGAAVRFMTKHESAAQAAANQP